MIRGSRRRQVDPVGDYVAAKVDYERAMQRRERQTRDRLPWQQRQEVEALDRFVAQIARL